MEKILYEYNKKCAINSNKASKTWKVGIIILSLLYMFYSYKTKQYFIIFFIYLALIVMLCFICFKILKKDVTNQIFRTNKKIKLKNLYEEIDRFQKDWINNYCNKNKINSISKLKILRSCLIEKRKEEKIKYINPIIIGTLIFTIWEIGLNKLNDMVGFYNMIIIAIVGSIIISMFIGIIKKELNKDKDLFLEFDKFSSEKRLEDLLLYEILRCKRK